MKFFTCFILLISLLPAICFGQELKDVFSDIPPSIQTPRALANWFSNEFTFRMEYPDSWQPPQETIRSKSGDCEDFAILASVVLTHLGIPNEIIIIRFKGLNVSHAICIWKDKGGLYSFISNRKLCHTGKGTIEDAVGKFYPDWESFTPTEGAKQYTRMVKR